MAEKYPEIEFQVFHEDNGFTPKGGVDSYYKLRNTNAIDAIITHTSPVAVAVQPLAEQDGILQMAVSASAGGYSSPDDLSFRTTAGTDNETSAMVEFIQERGLSRVGIVYMNNEIGVSLRQSLTKQLASTTVVLDEGFSVEETDFRTLITKLKQLNADAVYVAGTTAHLSTILKQSGENALQTQFLGFRTVEDPSLIKNSGALANGVIYTYGFDATRDNAEVGEFTKAYQEKFGVAPNGLAAEGYEGYRLVAESFAQCGRDYECIGSYLQNLKDYRSVFGPLSFDENGDVFYEFFLKTVRNGEFVALD
jgi:branched-chain amino acid transport system substrate-binding protein